MKVKFQELEISPLAMEDGDIALVTQGYHKGRVVQRYGSHLISIGKNKGDGWTNFFNKPSCDDMKVKILKSGDTIIL